MRSIADESVLRLFSWLREMPAKSLARITGMLRVLPNTMRSKMKHALDNLVAKHGVKPVLLDDDLVQVVAGDDCRTTCAETCGESCDRTCCCYQTASEDEK